MSEWVQNPQDEHRILISWFDWLEINFLFICRIEPGTIISVYLKICLGKAGNRGQSQRVVSATDRAE